MKLTFLGATETVTGSKYLLEIGNKKILIDCGLFQGRKDLRLMNWEKFPIKASSIDCIILTHAHIDHSGYIPRLVKQGFHGKIYCSEATKDLCNIMLPDAAHLQEEDAEAANRHHYSRHHPALPLYTEFEARRALRLFKSVPVNAVQKIDKEFSFSLHPAGHIPGACFVRVETRDKNSILFSGDVGRLFNPMMKPPSKIIDSGYLVVESTYGDRLHGKDDPMEEIGEIVRKTAQRGGSVVIPAFAVGRAQAILHCLYILKQKKLIPNIPIYLDSPMAIKVTDLLVKHAAYHRLSAEECEAVSNIAIYANTPEESKAINHNNMPKVIVSASGMATGGRILHHLKHYVGDPRNTILLPGFQAYGTRGDRLARGEKEIKIHGSMWPVQAEIQKLDNMSAHADYNELLEWMGHMGNAPQRVFVTHGEKDSAYAMKQRIEETLHWPVTVPAYLQEEVL